MSSLMELKSTRKAALDKAEAIVAAAENAGRALTQTETADLDASTAEVQGLNSRIEASERLNTLRAQFPNGVPAASTDGEGTRTGWPSVASVGTRSGHAGRPKVLGTDYLNAFQAYLLSGGERMDAALYEGRTRRAATPCP